MSDTLKIFGSTYTDVTSIKAKDLNGNTLVFTKGGGVVIVSDNLHDTSEDVPNTYINGSTETSYNGWTSTGYIPVKPDTYYRIKNGPSNNYNALYASDKSPVKSGFKVPGNTEADGFVLIKTTSDTSYIRMSAASSNVPSIEIYEVAFQTPTGTVNITSNGTVNVSQYETANVNVSGGSATLGTKSITANGTYSAEDDNYDGYSSVEVNVPTGTTINNQDKSVTPSETAQTITADSGYTGLGTVSVGAISSTYVGSGITQRSSSDLTASNATVTVPAGYYSAQASKAVASGSATTPATTITANPTISVGTDGKITATTSTSQNITPTVSAGYVSTGTAGKITVSGSNTEQLTTQAAKTVTPTESEQTAVASGVYTTGAVKVGAISDTYVGSKIAQNDSTDLSASGATVTVPAGYYAENASKSVSGGSATTPTTTITANPNISVSSSGLITATASASQNITPTVSAGYVSTGTAGTVTVSGSKTQQLTTKGATTYNTSTTDQTIASGTYLTGTQTIKAVKVSGLDASKIASGTTVTVGDANDADRIASVTGTLSFVTYYTGSSAPSSSLGENGSIYLKTTS